MYDEVGKDDADLFYLDKLRRKLAEPSTLPTPVLLGRRDGKLYNWAEEGAFDEDRYFDTDDEPIITPYVAPIKEKWYM
jgi:hypothetical protein